MWRKRHTPEETFAKLLQVDVVVTLGRGVADERDPVAYAAALGVPAAAAVPMDAWLRGLHTAPRSGSR
jgi:hypothetical protein